MRLTKTLALLLILQISCTFVFLLRMQRVYGAIGRIMGEGKPPRLYEVGVSRGDIETVLGRSKLTPDYIEGFLAGKKQIDIHIETVFLREKGDWKLTADCQGKRFMAEGISLSSVSSQLLGEIDDRLGVLSNEKR